ncbi:L-tyrosine/L-tryptophan isonitrile synthase family protein [Lentzea sp. NPDC051838]|uniref:L-tyrosine/L-tryptophan isonitrile synthase family protein n=1 Tax=Lentzea sp. NPDC051838 TaxID=3154849 RepID=UPI003439BCAE
MTQTLQNALNAEQRRSQISGGHRLISQVRSKPFQLYSQREFASRAVALDATYWVDEVMPALAHAVSRAAAARVDAALGRARKQAKEYGVAKPGAAELVAEALFDGRWFKARKENFGRAELRDQVLGMISSGRPVELVLPLFSRKPFSPVKNRGRAPDTAEIHSLARCAALAHTLNALSPTGAVFRVLADGRKYNRACRTPDDLVLDYQDSLRLWVRELGASDVLEICDYEDWVRAGITSSHWDQRASRYAEWVVDLERDHTPFFDETDPVASLDAMTAGSDVGSQLAFTFWSIATSACYSTFDGLLDRDHVVNAYSHYVTSLRRPLTEVAPRADIGFEIDHGLLRREAFSAACRYVAISLADRDLDVLRTVTPDAVKLTIHGKPGELHFVTATSRDANMTAQHCTGGYDFEGGEAKPTFRYLIEREAAGEIPVLVSGARHQPDGRFRALARLEEAMQPIAYVTDAAPVLALHQLLERAEV